jgi:pyrroline-5-carboxylate reductase
MIERMADSSEAESTIAFIGGGNMARSLVGGLTAQGWPQDRLWVADPDPTQRKLMLDHYPRVHLTEDNKLAVDAAGVLVMAVKPQLSRSVAQGLASTVQQHRPLVISIVAGIRAADLERWLGGKLALVRCMSNTPALVQSAATGLYANPYTSHEQRATAERILKAVGLTLWIDDEALLDAVTALSGSGPAYFLRVMEALESAGVQLGLSPEAARALTLQTALGTAQLALTSGDDPATLRARVTSKGGTTEQALAVLERGGLEPLFASALSAAARRARELADHFAEEPT